MTDIAVILAVLLTFDAPLLASYTQVFMGAADGFITLYFPVFLLGAIFGKLMEDSGSAEALANAIIARLGSQRAILAVVLSCALMTYGGVSLFVVAFAVYPVAAAQGISPELLHRVTPVATGGLDTLPHNGVLITLLAICGLTHRQAYFDLAMTAMVMPFVSLVLLLTLGALFGSF